MIWSIIRKSTLIECSNRSPKHFDICQRLAVAEQYRDQTCFPCIDIRWVPREVLKTEGAARVFHNRPRNPANVNARKNMFDRYYFIKVSKKLILERYFDVLFWHYFVLIFLHRSTKIISIYILVPGPSVNNYSIMAENWQGFTTCWQNLQNVVVVCHLF